MVILVKRRIRWSMTSNFTHLSRIGKHSSYNGVECSYPKNLDGIGKRTKVCDRPSLNGNMLAGKRPQSARERTRIVGYGLSGEVRNHKKVSHSRRSLRPLLKATTFVEFGSSVHCPDGDSCASFGPLEICEQHPAAAWNYKKSIVWSRSRDLELSVEPYCSRYCTDALLRKDWETLARTRSGFVRNLKVSERKRGFQMKVRDDTPWISSTAMRASKMLTSVRRIKVLRSGKGRLPRTGVTTQMPSRVGSRNPQTSVKDAGSKHLSPLLLRRPQIRFRWNLSGGSPDRIKPKSCLRLGFRRVSWMAKRENAAIVLQAQWRMCLARHSYLRLQRATLAIQRRWRETYGFSCDTIATLEIMENETSAADFIKSNICSETSEADDLAFENSVPATLGKELTGEDSQSSPKMHGLSVERLYDANISEVQEDEIFGEFLSFLPSPELSPEIVLASPTRTGSDILLESRCILLQDSPLATPHSPDSPEASSTVIASDDCISLHSPPSTKTWNFDVCNLDSPACSHAKELTFARISIDGSLPPTPIKEWSSRKRDLVKRVPAVPVVWDPSSTLDIVEVHHSPTKDWASPLTRVRKPALALFGSPEADLKTERFQLPSEWFMDLDELDMPESCWDTSKVTSTSFSPPPDSHLNSLHGFTEVPSTDSEMRVPCSRALICIPEEFAHNVSPTQENRDCTLIANSAVIEKSPISVKLTDDSFPETVDPSRWRYSAFSDEDADEVSLSPSYNVTTKPTDASLESPLSPALEEELLDELTKLFQVSPDPTIGLSDVSSLPSGPRTSVNELHCSDSPSASHPKALSRVCIAALGKDGFLGNSARKLNFNLEDEDRVEDGEDEQGEPHHDGEHEMPLKNMERMSVVNGRGLSQLSRMSKFSLSELAMRVSQESIEFLDGSGPKHLEIYEELDEAKASRDPRSYSKRCQSTVTDFLQLVESNLVEDAGGSASSPERDIEKSSYRSSSMQQIPEPERPVFEDEDDFCDKAVDGNVVAVRDKSYQDIDLLPDPFHASRGWELEASATESPNKTFGPPADCGALDIYDASLSKNFRTFFTPKIQRPSIAITRSCGAINKTKPPLPVKSRRISFDQINHKSNEPFIPVDEKRLLSREKKASERLLHTSPISPDTPLLSYSTPGGCKDRSSALSVSRKYFLQSPSPRPQSGKCDSDMESVVTPASSQSSKMKPSHDGVEKKTSANHARALFTGQELAPVKTSEDRIVKSASIPPWNDASHYSCFEDNYEAMLKHRDTHRLWFPDNLSGPLVLTNGTESDYSFRKSTSSAWDCGLMTLMTDGGFGSVESSSPSLHDLCKLWDEECMDLVTRSLKYKSLMTDPNLLRHELKVAFEKTEPSSPQNVAWEIQNIERLKEKLECRERLKVLIRQQRDTIYINIATNASMRERYRLYSKWGIRRMSRARLRKVIYELLWKDPKRFHASADLVLQYL